MNMMKFNRSYVKCEKVKEEAGNVRFEDGRYAFVNAGDSVYNFLPRA